ncbi:MAG: bacillithiol system redox-active protein YtxJ [Flavobacteriaceae bacterium]|nr:bacillithiol system redox-active protein YtxJ [Flavobacteriaceae bacterium]
MSFLGKIFGSEKVDQNQSNIRWNSLSDAESLTSIQEKSHETPQVIFKHSTRCGISRMALKQFEKEMGSSSDIDLWLLDVLNYRNISNQIAQDFKIEHQSPQVLMLKNGKVIYADSHYAISAEVVMSNLLS